MGASFLFVSCLLLCLVSCLSFTIFTMGFFHRFPSQMRLFSTTVDSRRLPLPNNFGANFQIPSYPDDEQLDYLKRQNHHPNDELLSFDKNLHKYYYKGNMVRRSVTQVVESYFDKFDAKATAEKMLLSDNWPRAGYVHKDGSPYTFEEILRKWEEIGEYARNQGTWMHYNIERIFNGLPPVDQKIPELKQFLAFKNEILGKDGIVPFRTEWRIVAPSLGIAGSIDFVGRSKSGEFIIMDWKRSKKLSSPNNFVKYAKPPIDHLLDCEVTKYSLQLNLYRYLLENYYQISISKCVLASFHPDLQTKYFYYVVPNLQKEIKSILDDLTNEAIKIVV